MKLVAIELEPTPYKYDLWNEVHRIYNDKLIVIFTQSKNWSYDGGHDYKKLPNSQFIFKNYSGGKNLGELKNVIKIILNYLNIPNTYYLISGYSTLESLLLTLYLCVSGKKFIFVADSLNNNLPNGRFKIIKCVLRNILRKIIFKQSRAVLMCGKIGIQSAVVAKCPKNKIYDFPYVVDINRILKDNPENIPIRCLEDISSSKIIVFFSGRMIERKGLRYLLEAVSSLKRNKNLSVWIEGDGPKFEEYRELTFQLDIVNICFFLGFCQYDLHSWLLRESTIVVVPSTDDNWGIVVDEALQLGKPVISTSRTGSAIDRIINGVNGFIVDAKNSYELFEKLSLLIKYKDIRSTFRENAITKTKMILPKDNAKLINLLLNG
jgi:glycosyltransferase involved in cell wall biosynthesis